ncbi:MAG: hypothetical protein A3B74_04930 [Candidatus Kerfeldbacteria bacterium RIFCSPHIGHO2_02_FULL_42_14]|uniref:Polysaccharide chain length determinant N-terminal domain-containing protein n=1 Tax=Candidatus Kerfeldbacteria bacterium RIFCSPHIGHO2_02_FULL_42_14 TaxID=1798540 RepID=A0A1G2AQ54_9BACT|nr:MAG: hypothetical protein A3B74_04930 [Candidatus Kerfeldbacteria bacterium RIFCSPHIGHO2_02_FULL_42_14]OGY81065.1 MAG: hypothetical protein A3E60_03650 [Candidatus Kerfeldbacteria bacterium RIFCSPHIGHO2_12_FULL_42_13]OGY84883.1 MAG: hypothetical protein A3I91_05295 [Candidatus Kerfeldbacteria bacterium RIFCSPLOWO2_02_FULL_42_19]OGY86796.1 MAG: hypothetical protein A3G01_02595 [Candidatus Kerfeldbacteria bacterium RIFCSPLOWO2_12_FULL_43_9]
MEFKDHIRIIKNYKKFIVSFTVVVIAGAAIIAWAMPERFKTSVAFAINRGEVQQTTDYQYDGYYVLRAAELYAQNIVSWFLTPSFLVEVYEKAKIPPEITNLERFGNRFKTKQYSPQNIVVTFTVNDRTTAEKLAQSIIATVEEQASAFGQSVEKDLFMVVGSQPVIVNDQQPAWLIILVGGILGLIVSFILVYIHRYLKAV